MLSGVMSFDFCSHIWMPWIHPSCINDSGGGGMVWGTFSWHTLGPLISTKHRLNATGHLSIVSEPGHPFMTTVN